MQNKNSIKRAKYQQINYAERKLIEKFVRMGKKISEIARILGRHRSTISRLLNNKANTDSCYRQLANIISFTN